MAALAIALLLAGVAGAVGRPFGLPAWVLPVAAATVDLAAGSASLVGGHRALDQLAAPVAFLLAAVPLSVLLDGMGFFAAAARALTRRGGGAGWLWVLAAAVTTVLNLDASVVLLTPLYVRFARAQVAGGAGPPGGAPGGAPGPLALALQPLILSWLASSALPVSNLTNLIAVSSTGATVGAFVAHLGPPSAVAAAVGWLCYRRFVRSPVIAGRPDHPTGADRGGTVGAAGPLTGGERRALVVGGALVAVVLLGFVAGRSIGVAEWQVAVGADLVLLVLAGRQDRSGDRPDEPAQRRGPDRLGGPGRPGGRPSGWWGAVPWRAVPAGTALVALSLGVLASAAVAHVAVGHLLGGGDIAGLARTAGVTALAANVVNNLPALLVTLPSLGHRAGPSLWAALIGVNMGPVLVVTGTLASLLWVDTLERLGVAVRRADVTRAGLAVGLPAGLAGLGTLLALQAAGLA